MTKIDNVLVVSLSAPDLWGRRHWDGLYTAPTDEAL